MPALSGFFKYLATRLLYNQIVVPSIAMLHFLAAVLRACCLQIKYNLLEPIITVFVANGERYNLLNSVVLELFDFIRREGIKSLIEYFVHKLYSQVEDVDYDVTFLKLKDKYEQSQGFGSADAAAASSQLQVNRLRRDERALDRGAQT